MSQAKVENEFRLEDVWNASNAIIMFTNQNKLDLKLGWAFEDVVDALEKPVKRYNEERDKMVRKFGAAVKNDKDQPTGRYNITDQEGFQKATDKLGDNKVKVEFYPIDMNEVEKAGLKMNGQELRPMRKLGVLVMLPDEPEVNGEGEAKDIKTPDEKKSEMTPVK